MPKGEYISRQAAAYPAAMNRALTVVWLKGVAVQRLSKSQASAMVKIGKWSNTLVAEHMYNVHKRTSGVGTPTTKRLRIDELGSGS